MVDATKIIATFDFTGAPHGLYDLKVINPDGDEAIIPYRFLVERAIEPEVTIGVGGPRVILAGDLATYSVALQSLCNLDAPYVYFQVGVPADELSTRSSTACRTSSSSPTCAARPRARRARPTRACRGSTLESITNTNGQLH